MKQQLPNMEFGRRLAAERDLEKSDQFNRCNISRFSLTIDKDYVDNNKPQVVHVHVDAHDKCTYKL